MALASSGEAWAEFCDILEHGRECFMPSSFAIRLLTRDLGADWRDPGGAEPSSRPGARRDWTHPDIWNAYVQIEHRAGHVHSPDNLYGALVLLWTSPSSVAHKNATAKGKAPSPEKCGAAKFLPTPLFLDLYSTNKENWDEMAQDTAKGGAEISLLVAAYYLGARGLKLS
jgi:hypothetical protein